MRENQFPAPVRRFDSIESRESHGRKCRRFFIDGVTARERHLSINENRRHAPFSGQNYPEIRLYITILTPNVSAPLSEGSGVKIAGSWLGRECESEQFLSSGPVMDYAQRRKEKKKRKQAGERREQAQSRLRQEIAPPSPAHSAAVHPKEKEKAFPQRSLHDQLLAVRGPLR